MPDKDIEQKVREMIETGVIDRTVVDQLRTLDPQDMDRVLALLKDQGADQMGDGPALVIEDHYRDGPGKYVLNWPLGPSTMLPMPFEDLDRKTQFFVLWTEWTYRELDAMTALNEGNIPVAERLFAECAERAKQLDVPELLARSYDGQVRVAEKRGDMPQQREWAARAAAARHGS